MGSEQMDLSSAVVTAPASKVTTDVMFQEFRKSNPQVEKVLYWLICDLRRRGIKRASMRALFEQVRWERFVATRGEPYKLNNNFTRFYVDHFVARFPELAGFFDVRERR